LKRRKKPKTGWRWPFCYYWPARLPRRASQGPRIRSIAVNTDQSDFDGGAPELRGEAQAPGCDSSQSRPRARPKPSLPGAKANGAYCPPKPRPGWKIFSPATKMAEARSPSRSSGARRDVAPPPRRGRGQRREESLRRRQRAEVAIDLLKRGASKTSDKVQLMPCGRSRPQTGRNACGSQEFLCIKSSARNSGLCISRLSDIFDREIPGAGRRSILTELSGGALGHLRL